MKAWNKRKRPKHWTKPKWVCKKVFGKKIYVLKSVYTRKKILFLGILMKSKCLSTNFIQNEKLNNFKRVWRIICKSR